MWSERRRKQLKNEGVDTELVEETADRLLKVMKEAELTVREGILAIKKMDCILSEMTKCNPNSKIK